MASQADPHLVIVNRNYPPRTGVTGESACTFAGWLQSNRDVRISIVTVRSNYAGGGSRMDPIGEVHEIGSWYDGKNKWLRLISGFVESFRLILKARRLRGTSTIVMTDPIFLSAWAALLLGKRKWGLWSMDLYPEAFVAGRLVSDHNLMYRFLRWIVYRSSPSYLIALGELQAGYLTEQYGQALPTAILPCGVYQATDDMEMTEWKNEHSDKIILGYCGNLGEAHSVEFLHAVVAQLDPAKFHLVLTVYGAKSKKFLDELGTDRPGVSLIDSVSRINLGLIDVHLVSLLGNWVHVCVPSKAVSAVCSGSSFLFYGKKACDNWQMLGDAGWIIEETDGDLNGHVKDVLSRIDESTLAEKKACARSISENLNGEIPKTFELMANLAFD